MLEIKNTLYTQRFYAKTLPYSDLFKAVTYTQFEGELNNIPFWYEKHPGETATIDLTKSEEELYKDMKSNTRNEIKRAEKEGCTFETNYDYELFVPFYNAFCESKGLAEKITVATLAKYDKMIIGVVRHGDTILAMHANVVNQKDGSATLFYSCSMRMNENVDRKLIGWGNRYLHWKEFLLFKEMKLNRYEWNGISSDPDHPEWVSISQFKLGFGGTAKYSMGLRTPLFIIMKKIQKWMHR